MRVRRRSFVDEYVEGGESAVMIEDRILVLSRVATAALSEMNADWTELSDLAAHLGRTFGAPAEGVDVMQATEATIRGLAAEGVVEIAD